MKLRYLSIISLLTIALFSVGSLIGQDAATDVWQQIDDLNDAKDFDGAYALLEPLAADYGNDVAYLWRIARHHFNESDNTTDEEVIERELYQGFEFAKEALAADSMNSYANGYYGILIGRVGEIEGTKQKILNSYDVAKYTERAIELDPAYDSWQHVMGRWHYTLADLSWFERTIASIVYADPPDATFEEAEVFFMKAAELAPDDIRHFLWLGKTRMELDKDEVAREALEMAVKLPMKSDSDAILQDEAKELLEDLD
jgi:tetratricopeptide (TPR) repeat protein